MTLQEQLRKLTTGGPGVTHIATETLFEDAATALDAHDRIIQSWKREEAEWIAERDALAADNAALRVEIAQWRGERDALAAELAGRKDYIARLEARTDKALSEHVAGALTDMARVAALEADRDFYKTLVGRILMYKDDVFNCTQCGHAEPWWTDSNADYATRDMLNPSQSETGAAHE